MKKLISVFLVLVLCVAMPLGIFASADEFVPSVSYKDAPDMVGATAEGENVSDQMRVTSLLEALNGQSEASSEAIALLKDVYNQLMAGTTDMPIEGNFVIRDLFDVSILDTALAQKLADGSIVVEVVFDTTGYELSKLVVMNYHDEQWHEVEVIDNGDGTITCRFTHLSPVAFVELGEDAKVDVPAKHNLGLWIALVAVVVVAAIAVVVIYRRKIFR